MTVSSLDAYRSRALARRGVIVQQAPAAAAASLPAPRALTAAASRPAQARASRPRSGASPAASRSQASLGSRSWQAEAWAAYDEVGEERFLASTLAGRLSQARLYVQHKPATGPHSSLRDDETDATDTAPARPLSQRRSWRRSAPASRTWARCSSAWRRTCSWPARGGS